MTMIRVTEGETIWPYSLGQLRADEPTKSFSSNPSDRELAVFGVFRVLPQAQPEIDPANQKVVETQPALEDGTWKQQWEIVELSDSEKEAYYRATHPPRWQSFGAAVWSMAEVNELLATALQGAPALAMALPVGLGQAAQGDQATFMHAWQSARAAGLVADELVAGLQMLAVQHDIPAAFVAGLGAVGNPEWEWPENPTRFQPWTAPDGSEWVYDQPRDPATGQYLADDPETEAVESALQWLPVEVE
jgi:hypothetical protein